MCCCIPGVLLAFPVVTWSKEIRHWISLQLFSPFNSFPFLQLFDGSGFGVPKIHGIHLHISAPRSHHGTVSHGHRCAGSESLDLILLKGQTRLFHGVHCATDLGTPQAFLATFFCQRHFFCIAGSFLIVLVILPGYSIHRVLHF